MSSRIGEVSWEAAEEEELAAALSQLGEMKEEPPTLGKKESSRDEEEMPEEEEMEGFGERYAAMQQGDEIWTWQLPRDLQERVESEGWVGQLHEYENGMRLVLDNGEKWRVEEGPRVTNYQILADMSDTDFCLHGQVTRHLIVSRIV